MEEVPPPGVGGMVRVSYSEMGCQPFQERCQTYQEMSTLSSITSDNNIRKRAKNYQHKSGKDMDRQPSISFASAFREGRF